MSQVLVSVIIPAYNAGHYLNECVDSVLNQTNKEIEIIIINDGSVDNTLEIIKEYEKADPRIKTVSQDNRGQGSARNTGIEIARGEAIMFLDADDYFTPEVVDTVYTELKQNQSEIVIFNGFAFWESEESITERKKRYFALTLKDEGICRTGIDFIKFTKGRIQSPCLKIYSKDFLVRYSVCFADGGYGEDTPFFYKAFITARRVRYMDFIGYHRRYRKRSTMTSTDTENIKSRIMHFPLLLSLIDELENQSDKRIVLKQYVYYAILLWIMIYNRRDKDERWALEALFKEYRLEELISECKSNLIVLAFSFLASMSNSMAVFKVIAAKAAKKLLKNRTRFSF